MDEKKLVSCPEIQDTSLALLTCQIILSWMSAPLLRHDHALRCILPGHDFALTSRVAHLIARRDPRGNW